MRNRLVIFIVSPAMIVTLFLLFVCKLDNYKDNLRYKLDPLETNRLASQTVLRDNGLWIIGDSRAASWETAQLGFIRTGSSNLGIRGQTSKQAFERFSNDLERSRPYCVLIQVGINDLKSIGLLEETSITRNCILNTLQILETCKAHNIEAIYSSIFPPGDIELFRRPFWDPTTIDSLRRVNDEIKRYCLENGFIWFDTYKILENQARPGTVKKDYQSDYLHINTAGYNLISDALQHLLRTSDEEWVSYLLE